MKSVILIVAIGVVTVAGDCIYGETGHCIKECPPHTVSYTSACGETFSQKTCASPQPRNMGVICDLSRCDCADANHLWDEVTNACVLPTACSQTDAQANERV